MEFRPSTLLRVAAPLRSLAQRFMYVSLIVLSFGLMLVGKMDVVLIDHLRAEVTNVAAPVLQLCLGLYLAFLMVSRIFAH